MINTAGRFTGSVFNSYNNITQYISLKEANELLAEENTRIRQQLEMSFIKRDTGVFFTVDSLYKYIHARVINNSTGNQKNYMILNKGSDQGIRKDMGVITTNGVAGTVVEVSENYSRVMSLLHISNRINARVKKNRHLGNIEWDGRDYRYGVLTDIPSHVELSSGDEIITSGNSNIFPEGIPIGVVDVFHKKAGDKFNSASVLLSVDFNNIYDVYIIVNLYQPELNELKTNPE